jgi:dienelactone hydrolase
MSVLSHRRSIASLWALLLLCAGFGVQAQQEFPPPQGKGRVVLVLSGIDGAPPYEGEARRIAALGYDAILIDANTIPRDSAPAVMKAYIDKALAMPHALPGKVAIVGYSLGGGRGLQAAAMPAEVAVIIAWYPATTAIAHQGEYVKTLQVPVLMFAAEDDKQWINPASQILCCSIANARALAGLAVGRPLELVTYRSTAHGFIAGKPAYNAQSYADASKRMTTKLAQYLQ